MMLNKISIVMTTYNGERFIIDQLRSIIDQTREPDEILIFDDGSQDSTVKKIRNLIQTNPKANIKLEINSENKGWQKNFIDGISQATGDIVFLADQDDIWEPDKIERMSGILLDNNSIDVLVSNYKVLNMRESSTPEDYQEAKMLNDNSVEPILIGNKFYAVERPGCTFCFRKDFFDEIKSLWVEKLAHDQLIWTAAILKKSLYLYNMSLISFRRHDNNASGRVTLKVSKEKRLLSINNNIYLVNSAMNKYLSLLNEKEINIIKKYLDYESNREKLINRKSLIAFMNLLVKYPKYRYSIKSNLKDLFIAFR